MDEIISYQDLKNYLLSIGDQQMQALFCTIYAGMAREGEIVKGRYTKTPGIQAEDVMSFDNRIELIIRSEKSRRRDKTGLVKSVGKPVRKVPIYRNREAWLCNIVEGWARFKGSGSLFPFSTRWAEHQFHIWFPDIVCRKGGHHEGGSHTIHWLRGWRYTHYRRGNVTGLRVDSKVVSLLGGWVNSSVPERYYDFTSIDDYAKELENKREVVLGE